jgi:hypothetical protein
MFQNDQLLSSQLGTAISTLAGRATGEENHSKQRNIKEQYGQSEL